MQDVEPPDAESAYRLQGRLGDVEGVVGAAVEMNLAMFDLVHGRFDRALQLFDAALVRFRVGGAAVWQAGCENHLANAWMCLGQTARAQQALTPMPAAAPPHSRARRMLIEGRIARLLGRTVRESFLHRNPVNRAVLATRVDDAR